MASVVVRALPILLLSQAAAETEEDWHDGMSLIQSGVKTRADDGTLTPTYFWPSGRGLVGSYTASPFPATRNLSSPSWTWRHELGDWYTMPIGTSIDDRKNIYLTVADGVRKLTPDGQLVWNYTRRSPQEEITNAACLWNGAVYGITSQARAFALSMQTGSELWSNRVAFDADANSGFVSTDAGVMITAVDTSTPPSSKECCGAANHRVVGLNATDGALLWNHTPVVPVWSFMASFAGDGTFVFQDYEGRAYRCQVSNGSLVWRAGGVPSSWTDGSALLGPNNIVYTVANFKNTSGDGPGVLSAFALHDGTLLWKQTVPKPPNNMPAIGKLAGRKGRSIVLPIGQRDDLDYPNGVYTDVYAFDAATGELQWTFDGPTLTTNSAAGEVEGGPLRIERQLKPRALPNAWGPPTIDGKGVVYLGSQTGEFYALQDSDGDGHVRGTGEATTFNMSAASVGSSSPAIAPGIFAIGSMNKLYVWRTNLSESKAMAKVPGILVFALLCGLAALGITI